MTVEVFNNETSLGSWNIADSTNVATSHSSKQNVFKLTLNQYGESPENSLFTDIFKVAMQGNSIHLNSAFVSEFDFDGISITLTAKNAILEFAREEEV